jgi:protein-tyrosine-phosphatase
MKKMRHLVFVCTGNICRSPMAEGLMRHKFKEAGRDDLIVSSMGIHAQYGFPATEHAQKVCKEDGFDISSHKARYLMGDELEKADLILCMEPVHIKFVKTFFPRIQNKVFLLGAWPDRATRKSPIQDPMGGSYEKYQQVFDLIKHHIERIFPLL